MAKFKFEVRPMRPMKVPGARPDVHVVGSTIIAHFPQCMLKEPKPAPPVSRPD